MNAKKKNKKTNKPPNPKPPQNVEKVTKKDEKVEEVQPKCEVKEEILAPAVLSEVLVTPENETKEMEIVTPKKPKRNKGKNNKHDNVEEEKIEVQDRPEEIQTKSLADVETTQKINTKVQEQKDNIIDETSVVPSARKKKNKKKSQEKAKEEETLIDSTVLPIVETIESIEKLDAEIQELFSPKPETPKEGTKKKNKKKNRTDSEKSDKSDNMLSCTSDFQNILSDIETFKQDQCIPEANADIKNIELQSIHVKAEDEKLEIVLKTESEVNSEKTKELQKQENKGKKKNKKDKKQQTLETIDATKQIAEKNSPVNVNILLENIVTNEPLHEVKETLQSPSISHKEKEPSPKPKAKIAKPVEKKQKCKKEAQSIENLQIIESLEIVQENKTIDKKPSNLDTNLEATPTTVISEPQVEDKTTPLLSSTLNPVKNIDVPSDQTMGKKRKKSPKPQKNKEVTQTKSFLEAEKACETFADTSKLTEKDFLKACDEPISILSGLADSLQTQMQEKKQRPDLVETTLFDRPITPDIRVDNEGFEVKTNKKKKKSPKFPQTEAISEIKEPIISPLQAQLGKDKEEKPKQVTEKEIEASSGSCLLGEVEVKSARTESETSSCDLIPEVHFVRSSSSQQLDSNNNTVIQEVTNVGEMKLGDLHLAPLIQGSGETPIPTPEIISSGIRMTENRAKTPTDEKTDIKSKMMEVNQDMEELRLSIERSLAEFTALEKSENDQEKKAVSDSSFEKEKNPANNNEKGTKDINLLPDIKQDISSEAKTMKEETISLVVTEEVSKATETSPVCPSKKDNKGKSKSNKKGKRESTSTTQMTPSSELTPTQHKHDTKEEKPEKSENKSDSTEKQGKQQSAAANDCDDVGTSKDAANEKHPIDAGMIPGTADKTEFEPIEDFEDALTSSIDDVNKTFEMIAKEADNDNIELQKKLAANKPEINITEPVEDKDEDTNKNEKINPVSQPKNLLGHTNIPVQSNRTDYKKEKNKTPNARQARVKIKDSTDIETQKQSKESQTDSKRTRTNSDKSVKESFSRVKNENDEYVYKYSFRKVFLQSACHICNKELSQVRVPCGYCNLVFYCGAKHKDEDWPQHQALCFAVSTLAHMKDQKHIYADAQNCAGQEYRLLRMQMIVSCEKVLKRRLVPWEQEILLYPRMCSDVACREWRQAKLKDCEGCGQLSFCATNTDHLLKAHARWCKSYSLYQRLVTYQQTKGRLEPRLPTRVMTDDKMLEKMNEVLAAMYEEKIDMNDIQYASLTQLATAPLTTAYCLQLCRSAAGITNAVHKKHPFTIHVVGAELQFEADALNKWETFFLHLRPDVDQLNVVLVSPALNPGNLPLDLLGKIKLCDNCHLNKRRLVFKFEDNKNYFEYRSSDDFINPDIICAFNSSIQRSSIYNGKDPWPATINAILKLKTPFIITSYTLNELRKDIARIKQVSEIDFKFILEPGFNNFASVRPDRNFISDDEMPLLFKNYCVAVVVGC